MTTLISLTLIAALTACNTPTVTEETETSLIPSETENTTNAAVTESAAPAEVTVSVDYEGMTAEQIVSCLTLEQKASQMVQGAVYCLDPDQMQESCYGSVLSTYGIWPAMSADQWRDLVTDYQEAAMDSEAGIPFIYGNDSVHGVNTASGCVIFPQNINMGAANDPELTEEYGALVGSDMIYTGMIWNFGPVVTSSMDPRWGRTYECYSTDLTRITPLAVSYITGLQSQGVMACAKHFFGEGDVAYGTGEGDFIIDRGDAAISDERAAELLDVYRQVVDAGVLSVMVSHCSVNGVKMHENGDYISILKNDLGFEGIVISDWNSIHNTSGATLKDQVINAVNAGIDMFMEEQTHEDVRDYIIEGVEEGLIPEERIDDAVTRIINVKLQLGLFDDPFLEELTPAYDWNSDRSREVARQLAAESYVPLKLTSDYTLQGKRIFVTGPASDDTGVLCGGWTYTWQGSSDADNWDMEWCPDCNTILDALQENADACGYEIVTDPEEISSCDMVLLCVGEYPYSEWYGDTEDLSITGDHALEGNAEAIELAASSGLPVTTLIVAGRNVLINDYLSDWDNVIMCYLPGSEGGNAVFDVLSGNVPLSGTLPMPYYSSLEDLESGNIMWDVGFTAAPGNS